MEEKLIVIDMLDSIVEDQEQMLRIQSTQIAALQENYKISTELLAEALQENQQLRKENERLRKGRNTWRTISILEGAAIAVLYLLK